MTTPRLIWILWCLGWAGFWFILGLFTFALGWLMVPPSLLAILIPIGKQRPPYQPPQWAPRP